MRGAQQYIQDIIDSMPSIVIGLTREGRISHWNREADEVFGRDARQMSGNGMVNLPGQLGFLEVLFRSSMESREVVKKSKVPLMLGDDEKFCDVTVYPLDADSGAVIRIDDVSDLVRLEEVMIQSEKMLSLAAWQRAWPTKSTIPSPALCRTYRSCARGWGRTSQPTRKPRTTAGQRWMRSIAT